jgi:hypothetical protein
MTDANTAFTVNDFNFDRATGTASCPGGHPVPISPSEEATFGWRCDNCPMPPAVPGHFTEMSLSLSSTRFLGHVGCLSRGMG